MTNRRLAFALLGVCSALATVAPCILLLAFSNIYVEVPWGSLAILLVSIVAVLLVPIVAIGLSVGLVAAVGRFHGCAVVPICAIAVVVSILGGGVLWENSWHVRVAAMLGGTLLGILVGLLLLPVSRGIEWLVRRLDRWMEATNR